LMHKPLMTSDATTAMRMAAIRATKETEKLSYSIATNPTSARANHKQVVGLYRDLTGRDMNGWWPVEDPMPWDEMVEYNKGNLVAGLNKYKKCMGLQGGV